jgi:hypothetical protein
MLVTLDGMVKSMNGFCVLIDLQQGNTIKAVLFLLYKTPSCEEYVVLAVSTFIAIRSVQTSKGLPTMLVTPLPMVMFLSAWQW